MHLGVGLDRAQRLLLERAGTTVPHQDLQIGGVDDRRGAAAEHIHAVADALRLPVAPAVAGVMAGRAGQHVAARQAGVEVELLSEQHLLRRVRVAAGKRDDRWALVLVAQLGDRVVGLRGDVG